VSGLRGSSLFYRVELPDPFLRLSDEAYAKSEGLSASHLRLAHQHPPFRLKKVCEKPGFETKDLSLGRLIHHWWLEPEDAKSIWRVLPARWEGSDAEARKARSAFTSEQKAQGKSVMPESLWQKVERGLEALNAHEGAVALRTEATCEVALKWWEPSFGVMGKVKVDLYKDDKIWDLKCYRGGRHENEFRKNMMRMGMFIQPWWQQLAFKDANYSCQRGGHIVLDTETWDVIVRQLSSQEMEFGELQARRAWDQLCSLSLSWVDGYRVPVPKP
jgi:hypothetical protein